jgi:hypothetical protein
MKAYAEFRVPESYAKEFLPAELGESIMDFVRKVRIPVESEMYKKIGEIYKLVRHRDKDYFFLGWDIQRNYSVKELESAELLLLKISKTFEPAGLECGTVYNNQNICTICGSGIRQVSELILDFYTMPKNVDIARTISNEIVISQEMAKTLIDNHITGYELSPVHHKASQTKATSIAKTNWQQLIVKSLVHVNPLTKTGNGPFDEDEGDIYRCKNGHTIGLNILSELSIYKNSWDGSDIVATKELLGVSRGLLRTYPLLLISQRLYRLMKKMKCKGFNVEVVKMVD